jgi:hypothetical protein
MSVHLHRARYYMGWFLVAAMLSPLALCIGSPVPSGPSSEVTGRVSFAHHPASEMIICLDEGDRHAAYAPLGSDGSFRLVSQAWTGASAEPGHYRAHLFAADAHRVPPKYRDTATSGIELDVAPGWNDFEIELP